MAFLVFLFFCGLSAGIVGRHKGSSFLLWFLVGFCLPVIGTVVAALYRSEREEGLRLCPECGGPSPLWAQVCSRCGNDLEFPDDEEIVVEPAGVAGIDPPGDERWPGR